MSDLNPILSANLRKRAEELNITQVELAEKTGIPKTTIGHYFTGKVKATLDNLIPISKVLNCTIGYLVGVESIVDSDIISIANHLKKYPEEIPLVKRVLNI